MITKTLSKILLCLGLVFSTAAVSYAAEDIAEGKIVEVVPSKREIYVLVDGKKNEYYFNDKTKLLSEDKEVAFDELKVGKTVKVTANKIGKRLDPQVVEIKE